MSYAQHLKASTVDLTFGIWAITVPVLFGRRLINGDGDMAHHVAMGDHLMRHGWIDSDIFSFTMAGERVVAYEWLAQLAYASFHRLGGIASVAIGAGLLVAAAYALIVLFTRRRGVDPLLGYLIAITAALLGSASWLARPLLFTLVGCALLLFLIEMPSSTVAATGPGDRAGRAARPAWRRRVWWFAPLFAVWANVHPGFVAGLAILAVYAAGDAVEAWRGVDRAAWLDRARYHAAGLGIAFAASLANPFGIGLHDAILTMLGNTYLIDRTGEFMSPTFHAANGKLFLIVIAAIVVVLALARRRLSVPRLFLMLFMLASALFAQRNIPLFGVLVLPVLALEYDGDWRRLSVRGLNHVRRVLQEGEAVAAPGRWFGVFGALMLVLAINHGRVAGFQAVPDTFDERVFPVEAVSWARQAGITGRMYHEFIWGGFILYAWPGQKIFIDGLTDVFKGDLIRDYVEIRSVRPEWDRKLNEYGITLVMIPPASPLAYTLERDGWRSLYSDETAVILERPSAEP